MALLALIDDMAFGQGVLSCTVKATWAVLPDDPADGSLVKDISWSALQGKRGVSTQICG